MAWTKEQIEALADKFAQVFVETVEHAGGTAKIVSSDASQQAGAADRDPLAADENNR